MSLTTMIFMAHVAYNYESYVKMTKKLYVATLKYWGD